VSVWDALTTRQIARILFTVAAFSGLLYLLVQIRSTLLLLGIAVFLAVALGPAVDFFSRRRLPRAAAILVVYVLIFCVFGGVLSLLVPPVINGATDLSRDLPSYIDDLRNNKTIRDFDNKYDITPRLQEEAKKLPSKLGDAAGALQGIAAGVVNTAFQLLTILTMTFFLLLDGRRISDFLVRRLGRHHREERLRGILTRIYKSTSGYVAGALTITSINGILTFIVLSILGVPFAVPLAVLMSFFGLIPLVGATIGGVIILIVTLFNDFPSSTIVYGIFLILYQQFENNVLQPFIFKRTVNVPPLAVIIAILAGSSILGVVGALVAIPIAAALQIVLREYYGDEPATDTGEPPPGEPPPGEPPPGEPPPGEPPPGPPPPPPEPPRSPEPEPPVSPPASKRRFRPKRRFRLKRRPEPEPEGKPEREPELERAPAPEPERAPEREPEPAPKPKRRSSPKRSSEPKAAS
jgi:predicted PurR-regulated permease PerM